MGTVRERVERLTDILHIWMRESEELEASRLRIAAENEQFRSKLAAVTAERDRLALEVTELRAWAAQSETAADLASATTELAAIDNVLKDDDFEYRFPGRTVVDRIVELDSAYRESTATLAALRASLREEVAPLLEDMRSFIRTPDLDKLYPEWFKRTAAAARSWATRLRETAQTHVAVVGIDPKVLREAAEYLNGEGPAAYLKWRQRDAHAATLRSYAEWLEGLR